MVGRMSRTNANGVESSRDILMGVNGTRCSCAAVRYWLTGYCYAIWMTGTVVNDVDELVVKLR